MKKASIIWYGLFGFLFFLGCMAVITGNPPKIYVLNNPDAFDLYLDSWLTHLAAAGIFFWLGILALKRCCPPSMACRLKEAKAIWYSLSGGMFFLGCIAVITGNPHEYYGRDEAAVLYVYLYSWLVHLILAGIFFWLGILALKTCRPMLFSRMAQGKNM